MKKILAFALALTLFFTACKPLENSVIIAPTNPPVVNKDITFSYSADQIRYADNNLKKAWASRNNVQVLEVSIVNNTEKPIHGSQLRFFSNNEQLKIVDNKLASEKLKTKKFPAAVYIVPIVLVGVVIYAALATLVEDDVDGDGFSDDTLSMPEKKEEAKDPLYKANLIQKKLYHFNIAKQTIAPGEKISGFIALKSKPEITRLDIKVEEVDYKVVGVY